MATYDFVITNGTKKISLHPLYGTMQPNTAYTFNGLSSHPLLVKMLKNLVDAGYMALTSGSFPTDLDARVLSFEAMSTRMEEIRSTINSMIDVADVSALNNIPKIAVP